MMNQILPKIPNINALCYVLGVKKTDLDSLLSDPEKYYYKTVKTKVNAEGVPVLDKFGNPKVRILFPSTGLLKSVQSKIRKKILTQVTLPRNIKGGVKGQDNIKNARFHVGNKYKFATDLRDFFPSISEASVAKMFRSLGYYPKISTILAKLVTYQGAVPQGAPTSTDLANLVFLPIDKKLIAFCSKRNIKYTRFVDDLSFSAGFNFEKDTTAIINLITPYFEISRNKTFFTSGKAKFTGVEVGVSSLDTDDVFKRKMLEDESKYKDGISPRLRYYKRVRNATKISNKAPKIVPH